ncbi:hypothetical protein [Antiquaquibacter soli]|uniref:DNA modification methylase n=1 Tax=Antiquaquibacter soli TaxID=3064523 RepID=A0ABT9BQR8_9MICO|nr:hypothetical protein [Protaetiibacter sp. WY-16]MDO7883369.1 hypothetical protein [Protaetiibacter sp. WY-16]
MITRSRAARAAATVVLAASIAVGTTGCVFITPTATLNYYDPSDGVGATVGDVRVLNMVGIINEDGHAISLVTAIHNNGRITNVTIQVDSDGEKQTITQPVRSGETVEFGSTPDAEQIVVLNPDVAAGGLLPVYVQQGDAEGKLLLVPVLEATGEYSELAPPAVLR